MNNNVKDFLTNVWAPIQFKVYKAEPMIGWTAGTYIYFNKELGLI